VVALEVEEEEEEEYLHNRIVFPIVGTRYYFTDQTRAHIFKLSTPTGY
jgi:hypothetical protein